MLYGETGEEEGEILGGRDDLDDCVFIYCYYTATNGALFLLNKVLYDFKYWIREGEGEVNGNFRVSGIV